MNSLNQKVKKTYPQFYNFLSYQKFFFQNSLKFSEYSLLKKARIIGSLKAYPNSNAQTILFFSARQDPDQLAVQSIIKTALMKRGNQILTIGCDKAITKACNSGSSPKLGYWQCLKCYSFAKKYYDYSKTNVDWLRDITINEDITKSNEEIEKLSPNDLQQFHYKNIHIGELVRVSVTHFLKTNSIDLTKSNVVNIYKNWLKSSIIQIESFTRYLNSSKPNAVFMINGLFSAERIMLEICKIHNIKVITYEVGFRPETFFFHKNRPVNMCDNDFWDEFRDIELTEKENNILNEYINERNKGKGYLVNYFPNINDDKTSIINQIGLDIAKKTFILFPNITWDSTLYNCDLFFSSMINWVLETISFFKDNPNTQLIIRTHPAESVLEDADREPVEKIIRKHFPKLPKNIIIIPSNSKISSYSLMDLADCGIVYGSTTGIEMGLRGLPVIVCGNIYYRKLGVTIDPDSKNEYFEILRQFSENQYPFDKKLSLSTFRKYAYYAIFRLAIPLKLLNYKTIETFPDLNIAKIEDIGNEKNLDIICDGILGDSRFISA